MNKRQNNEEFYKNEGIAIYVKGKMMIGIHPDNLESNTQGLTCGDIKIDWELLLAKINGTDKLLNNFEDRAIIKGMFKEE